MQMVTKWGRLISWQKIRCLHQQKLHYQLFLLSCLHCRLNCFSSIAVWQKNKCIDPRWGQIAVTPHASCICKFREQSKTSFPSLVCCMLCRMKNQVAKQEKLSPSVFRWVFHLRKAIQNQDYCVLKFWGFWISDVYVEWMGKVARESHRGNKRTVKCSWSRNSWCLLIWCY